MDSDQQPYPSPGKRQFAERHLAYALNLIDGYHGQEPFHTYLKKYFSLHKKHGAKDRRVITSLCYHYFRLGHGASQDLPAEEKILMGTFLCEKEPSMVLATSKPDWNDGIALSAEEKFRILSSEFSLFKLFRFPGELSSEIDLAEFFLSFIEQPATFLRIRPGCSHEVIRKLAAQNWDFSIVGPCSVAISGNPQIDKVIAMNKEAVIQDLNSQKTLDLAAKIFMPSADNPIAVWDCCAGSGGKSILVLDTLENIHLTVSDKRIGILNNLGSRFEEAGIEDYQLVQADLEIGAEGVQGNFDLVIADVPCSGSGTWARTPEQHLFFDHDQIERYATLQKKIITSAVPNLKDHGYLFYITCSVFRKENEENVDFFLAHLPLHLITKEYLKGYDRRADTLFLAVLQKCS